MSDTDADRNLSIRFDGQQDSDLIEYLDTLGRGNVARAIKAALRSHRLAMQNDGSTPPCNASAMQVALQADADEVQQGRSALQADADEVRPVDGGDDDDDKVDRLLRELEDAEADAEARGLSRRSSRELGARRALLTALIERFLKRNPNALNDLSKNETSEGAGLQVEALTDDDRRIIGSAIASAARKAYPDPDDYERWMQRHSEVGTAAKKAARGVK